MRKAILKFIRPYTLPLLGYLSVTFVFLFPAFKNINSGLWGFRGDNFFVLWVYWFRDFALLHNLNPDYSYYIGYPFGENIRAVSEEVLWVYPLQFLILLLGPFIAFNLLNIVAFVLGGFTAYLFVYYLTKNKLASFISGLIFTLAPYHFWQSYTHISLAITFWLPVYFLLLFKIWERPTVKLGALAGLVFGAIYYSSFYYGFFSLIITFFFVIGVLAQKLISQPKRVLDLNLIKSGVVFGLIILILLSPSIFSFEFGNRNVGDGSKFLKKPIDNLFGLSARPWDYLIPPPNHPVLGGYAERIYTKIKTFTNDYKTTSAFLPERVLYIGWLTFVFSLIGFAVRLASNRTKIFLMVSYLAIVIFLLSMPPIFYVGGVKIYFPSFFTYQFNHFARAYTRLGVFLLLFMLPLFVYGYEVMRRQFIKNINNLKFIKRPDKLFSYLVLFIVFLEFINFPPYYFTNMKLKDYYQYIKDQPGDFGIVEYPKNVDLSENLIYQFEHGKREFGMNSSNPYFPVFEKIDAFKDANAPSILDDFNIKYLVLHTNGSYHPIDETWSRRFLPSYPKLGNDAELSLVFEGKEAVVYKINPYVKSKVIVLSDDERVPKITIPSGTTWKIEAVSNLVVLNAGKTPRKIKVSFDIRDDQKGDLAYTLVNYEVDLQSYFENPLLVGENTLVVPVNLLDPLQQLELNNLKVEILE